PCLIIVQNSRSNVSTTGIVLLGSSAANLPTPFGGTVLVLPQMVRMLAIPADPYLGKLEGQLPKDPAYAGLQLDMQVIEIDPAASRGYSFTPGLELVWSSG